MFVCAEFRDSLREVVLSFYQVVLGTELKPSDLVTRVFTHRAICWPF